MHARLLEPEEVADALLRGLPRGPFLIFSGREARLAALASRLAPGASWTA